MDKFTEAYIVCALWSSVDDNDVPLDSNYSFSDIAPEALSRMEKDCVDFQQANGTLLQQAYDNITWYTVAQAGHDFWLTRNGHGAGFWDRGLGDVGEQLTTQAKVYGTCDLYVGDDGKVYAQ